MCRKTQNPVRGSLAGYKGASLMFKRKRCWKSWHDSMKNTVVKEFVLNDYENGSKHVVNGKKENSHRVKVDG